MSVTADIVAYLIAQSVGTSTTIYADWMPATPAAAMLVSQYAGRGPDFTTDGDRLSHPMIQIKVREQTPTTAWTWIKSAETALMSVSNSLLSNTRYQYVRPAAAPFMNGWSNNSIFILQNYEVCRSE